ncbi:M50 family metallopeptidase [Parvularcula lutaonensis]|uniref:M50 family metallopeptidase n=1 Tax=Parvularcula lutaonensis TaxID=491923 RepID=A0ABV7ME14_9PROT|nr:M50 family metallopeptidase [Parvularcula lutaonensis]GGY54423.1 putative zinc metalloprotease [Parvularcula lutaonensis]
MLDQLLSNFQAVTVSVLAFLVMLPLIVFIHELGHFQTGRLFGIKIDAFSIGFGPTLKSWVDRHGTVWKISAIPLGGYVKFFGDANAASAGTQANDGKAGTTQFNSQREALEFSLSEEEKEVCFHFRPVWQRAAVVAAGPIANFVLAVLIFALLFMTIGRTVSQPVVTGVQEGSAAYEAGFQPGDRILTLNGSKVRSFEAMASRIKLSSGEELTFTVDRDGEVVTLKATPRRTTMVDGFGNEIEAGLLGVQGSNATLERRRFGPVGAVAEGVREVGRTISLTARYFGRLLTLREDPRDIGGPVRIAQFAGQAASSGFTPEGEASFGDRLIVSIVNFAQVAALISISVGFLNLLPVPVLDGGHLLFYGYEAVAGKPMNEAVQGALFRVGLALVFTLIVFVLINDVLRLVAP